MLPCCLFEDEHLLVVNKPAGLNTHAPAPHSGQGLYEWLRDANPEWSGLAIIHRLDKETSGVILFARTPLACRSMTDQFAQRKVRKKYALVTDRVVPAGAFTVRTGFQRAGDKYVAQPAQGAGQIAETRFQVLTETGPRNHVLVEAEPLTGRTHQIRVHAQLRGFPILGDQLYGGSPAPRVCLHAAELAFRHPASGAEMRLQANVDFSADPRLALRTALIDPEETNAFRLVHGAGDGFPGWYVDRLGDWLLSQSAGQLTSSQQEHLSLLARRFSCRGAYHKVLTRHVRGASVPESSPVLISGEAAPQRFPARESGVEYLLSFAEGYSVGLFLDQRENRRRMLSGHVAPGFGLPRQSVVSPGQPAALLNTFAYTCGFSVCAARAGIRAVSLDLSRKYLEWGRENFRLNHLAVEEADFIYGDVFEWLRRLGKRGRRFDVLVLDPPTFSQSREHGVFRSEKDLARLASAALRLVPPGGVLFCSSNAAGWVPAEFVETLYGAVRSTGMKIIREHYVPQPPDFPISRAELAYLKTIWLQFG